MLDQPWGWLAIGFAGQALFSARFLVQWVYSERRKRSLIPVAFWYFSLAGGATLFTYALHIGDRYRPEPVHFSAHCQSVQAGQMPAHLHSAVLPRSIFSFAPLYHQHHLLEHWFEL